MATRVFGDATRGGAWAAVSLTVDGERVVAAAAPGLDRPLVGLTLLEAAAVGGEPLAVEALAAALGQVFSASPRAGQGRRCDERWRRQRRGAAPRRAGGDRGDAASLAGPGRPDTERACCSPAAVAAARAVCHTLGRPHVTLDLREDFKRAVVDPFTQAYEVGDTPNPCCAATAPSGSTSSSRSPSARGPRSYGRATTHASSSATADGSSRGCGGLAEGPVLHARGGRSRPPRARALPARRADEGGDARGGRGSRARGGCGAARARRRASSAATTTARFPRAPGLRATAGAIVDADGETIGSHDGYWRFTPGQRRGLGVDGSRPLYVLRTDAGHEHGRRRRARGARDHEVAARGRLYAPVTRAEVKLRYTSTPISRLDRRNRRLVSHWARRARVRRRHGPGGGPVRRGCRRWRRGDHGRCLDGETSRIPADERARRVSSGDVLDYALRRSSSRAAQALAYMLIRMGGTFARLSSFIKGSERDLLPVIVEARGRSTA